MDMGVKIRDRARFAKKQTPGSQARSPLVRGQQKTWSVPDFRDCCMKQIARSAIVEHSALAMYALVEDIEAYPRFLPWCVAATVHERQPGRAKATLTIGVGGLRHSFTTLNDNRPGEAIDMRLLEGPFRHF